MYKYPSGGYECAVPISVLPDEHTMGNSLEQYLKMKVHPAILDDSVEEIVVRGKLVRDSGVKLMEKNGKLFNYMRPTLEIEGSKIYLNCYPGVDYVSHYANIVASYLAIKGLHTFVRRVLPTERECWKALDASGITGIPHAKTVIMGYVEGLEELSDDDKWNGSGHFRWKKVSNVESAILLGCRHTYWGEIAGRIVAYLADLNVKRVIYSGKLGTLYKGFVPNNTIATGDCSILPNGESIVWSNCFSNTDSPLIKYGMHITVPSVLQETVGWLGAHKDEALFVDPEIGHMAYAASRHGIEFSYLHMVSDNLSAKYASDLSNERMQTVIDDRANLLAVVRSEIARVLNSDDS